MVLLQFRLNTGTYASNLRTFVWPHRVNQIFTMWPYKAKFPAGTHPGRPHTWPPLPETRAEEAFQNHHPCLQVLALGGKGKERASAGGKGKEPTSAEHPEQTSSRRSPTEQCPHEPRPPAQAPHLKRLPGRAGMEWRSCQTTKRKFHGTTTPRSPRRRSPQDISCRAPDAGARKTSRVERQMQELADARRVERAEYTAALDAVQPSVGDPLAEGYHASMRLVAQTLGQQFVWVQLMYGTSTIYAPSTHRDAANLR